MQPLRLATIGAGWITGIHLAALDRLGRTTLVGVASVRAESAQRLAEPRGASSYTDLDRMLDEQPTHLYDLARSLVGEATVVGAASTREEPSIPPDADVVDASAAVLRFANGAVGSFSNTRRLASWKVEFEIAATDLLITIRRFG